MRGFSAAQVTADTRRRLWVTLGITRIEHNESALFQWDDAGAKLAKVCVG
jgi:hypothetical protein